MDFFLQLLKFKTFNPNKEEKEKAAKFIKNYLENKGFDVEIIYSENDTPNILAKYPGKGKKVAFVTHFDVVPPGEGWNTDPFDPKVEGNKIIARGAADDKSAIVASIAGIENAKEINVQPILAIAGGEETQESTQFFEQIDSDIALVIDTGPYVSIGSSGFLGINIYVEGKQVHSAHAYRGENAIYNAAKVIEFIEHISKAFEKTLLSKYQFIEHYDRVPVRVNPTKIEVKPNVINIIPGEVKIYVNARTVPEYDNDYVFNKVSDLLKEFASKNNIKLRIEKDKLELPPWVSDGEHVDKFIQLTKDLLGEKKILELGGTDGYHFYKRGIKVIQFGPMREENNIHGPNEFVYIEDVERVAEVIKRVVENGL